MAPVDKRELRVCIARCAELKRSLLAIPDLRLLCDEMPGLFRTFASILKAVVPSSDHPSLFEQQGSEIMQQALRDCASCLTDLLNFSAWYATRFNAELQLEAGDKIDILNLVLEPRTLASYLAEIAKSFDGMRSYFVRSKPRVSFELTQGVGAIQSNISMIKAAINATQEVADIVSPSSQIRGLLEYSGDAASFVSADGTSPPPGHVPIPTELQKERTT